jgi:predicted ester cyclase
VPHQVNAIFAIAPTPMPWADSSTIRARGIHTMADGDRADFDSLYHPHAVDRENGRHAAPWAVYSGDGAVDTVFPAANKTFAATQSHWFRIEDGKIIEHWANRDDLGMAKQLGWIPPTPAYLLKRARAKRHGPTTGSA